MNTHCPNTISAKTRCGRDARAPRMNRTGRSNGVLIALGIFALAVFLGASPAWAQPADTPTTETDPALAAEPRRLEAVEVAAERQLDLPPQDVPAAVTAFESAQIDVLKVRNLTNLSIGLPNVQLDDRNVARGVAHFSIRGLGANNSLPAVDHSVGLFVDGVYVGTSFTALHDVYDLESIEILRGPQNTLFGRSMVGGAVLLETKRPTDRYEATVRSSVEGGGKAPNVYVSGMLNAPLTETLGARLNVYSNQDQGWFKNRANGKAFGAWDYVSLRPVVSWRPTKNLDLTLRYEWQDGDGDGRATQNRATFISRTGVFDRDGHDFAIDEEGANRAEVHFFRLQADWDVALGNGTVTNIFGWRDSRLDQLTDLDATPQSLLNTESAHTAEQVSNELRYTGVFFEQVFLTAGFSYFTNETIHHDRYLIGFPGGYFEENGGGHHDLESFALFLNGDYDLTDRLTLTAGLRWTRDEKEAAVAGSALNFVSCHVVDGPVCSPDYEDSESWTYWSPKVGLTYRFDERALIYGHWRRSSRPGGYNLRDRSVKLDRFLSPAQLAGVAVTDEFDDLSFDDERVDTFELGVKHTFGPGTYVNAAFFYNFVDDVRRQVFLRQYEPFLRQTFFLPFIRTIGDAETWGFEVEGSFAVTSDLTLLGSAGYLEADYTKVEYDLTYDGRVDGRDEDVELPRAPSWTYSVGVQHTLRIGPRHRIVSRANYAYRDKSYDTADNLGFNWQQKIVDAGLDLYLNDGQWVVGLYGRNLLNFARAGEDLTVSPTDGSISALERGRTFGLELTYNFRGV